MTPNERYDRYLNTISLMILVGTFGYQWGAHGFAHALAAGVALSLIFVALVAFFMAVRLFAERGAK